MSWQQLIDIRREAREDVERAAVAVPLACPNDGEPLVSGPGDGSLYCPFDGWSWPR